MIRIVHFLYCYCWPFVQSIRTSLSFRLVGMFKGICTYSLPKMPSKKFQTEHIRLTNRRSEQRKNRKVIHTNQKSLRFGDATNIFKKSKWNDLVFLEEPLLYFQYWDDGRHYKHLRQSDFRCHRIDKFVCQSTNENNYTEWFSCIFAVESLGVDRDVRHSSTAHIFISQ